MMYATRPKPGAGHMKLWRANCPAVKVAA